LVFVRGEDEATDSVWYFKIWGQESDEQMLMPRTDKKTTQAWAPGASIQRDGIRKKEKAGVEKGRQTGRGQEEKVIKELSGWGRSEN